MAIDRKIGRVLESFPRLHRLGKQVYLRAAYAITPKHGIHRGISPLRKYPGFFGYYDKSPWSHDGSGYLVHEPDGKGAVSIAVYRSDDRRILGSTTAWTWQQGAMAQWVPGMDAVVFNGIDGDQLVARVVGREGKLEHVSVMPVQTLHPNGREALTINYRRLAAQGSEYGYHVDCENFRPDQSEGEDGLWHFDLFGGQPELIISIADLLRIEARPEMQGSDHSVNHVMYSPSGGRFLFMHRWTGKRGRFSRLYVANNPSGDCLRLLLDHRMVSHYSWIDDDHVIVYGRSEPEGDAYYVINVITGDRVTLGAGVLNRFGDGHPTFSPDGRWVVTDTYPDKARMRHLILFDTQTAETNVVASFFSPWKFDGPNRVDLHPRWSPDGTMISIDSSHEGQRASYILNVSEFLADRVLPSSPAIALPS